MASDEELLQTNLSAAEHRLMNLLTNDKEFRVHLAVVTDLVAGNTDESWNTDPERAEANWYVHNNLVLHHIIANVTTKLFNPKGAIK
jgi:hypothetical protein